MRRLSAIHWGIIGVAMACTVLLGFVSTSPAEGKRPAARMNHDAHSKTLEQIVTEARKRFSPKVQQTVAIIEGSISTERDFVRRGQFYDSLVRIAGSAKEYAFAAWVSEQKAIKNNGSDNDWQVAGERYRASVAFQQDPESQPALFDAAMRCFSKAVELNPKNLDAKVGIGICIVESSGDPMQGIQTLLDVVKEDSTNVNAQLALGDFSVKRNAPDKAVGRYETALRLRPDYYGLHLNIAEQYQALGDTASAISHLEAYVQIETDPLVKNDVENAIRQLRKNPPKQ
jgi:tetratricopeptide (TPR) repeat protein